MGRFDRREREKIEFTFVGRQGSGKGRTGGRRGAGDRRQAARLRGKLLVPVLSDLLVRLATLHGRDDGQEPRSGRAESRVRRGTGLVTGQRRQRDPAQFREALAPSRAPRHRLIVVVLRFVRLPGAVLAVAVRPVQLGQLARVSALVALVVQGQRAQPARRLDGQQAPVDGRPALDGAVAIHLVRRTLSEQHQRHGQRGALHLGPLPASGALRGAMPFALGLFSVSVFAASTTLPPTRH